MNADAEQAIRKIIREELQEILLPLMSGNQSDDSGEFVDAKTAAPLLGFPNAEALYVAIKDNLFRLNKEVVDRRLPGRVKPRYQFNLAKCRSRLATDAAKRRAV